MDAKLIIGATLAVIYLIGGGFALRKGFRMGGVKELRRISEELRRIPRAADDVVVQLPGYGEITTQSKRRDLEWRRSELYVLLSMGLLSVVGGLLVACPFVLGLLGQL